MNDTQAVTLNALALYGLALLLAAAFAAQLLLHELPCPLCLAAAHSVRPAGDRADPQHPLRATSEPLCLVAADGRAGRHRVSTRQVLLHILLGDAGYGSALLGYHYYTWALIGFIAAIVLLAAMLLFDRQFDHRAMHGRTRPAVRATAAVWLVIGLTALNVLSTLLECGFGACADNPVV